VTTLHDALIAPDATVLEPGEKVDVSRQKLSGVGWQVSCVDGDSRVNAEALRAASERVPGGSSRTPAAARRCG
jgi:hypothetical protein